jgi:hypothetical protein
MAATANPRIDADRAARAYEDVLAVEYDEETDLLRVVTLSDSYLVDDRDGVHACPDREYNDVDLCKHLVAALATTGELNVPTGWAIVEDLSERPEDPEVRADGGETSRSACWCADADIPCFDHFERGDS